MKSILLKFSLLFFVISIISCKQETEKEAVQKVDSKNEILYAKGLEIYKYKGFSVVKVTHPWPEAKKEYSYVLHNKGIAIPDSLQKYTQIQVPIKSIVVTSTTHIPSLEILGVENTLLGFPNTDYVSSNKTRALIDAKKIQEIGTNQNLNSEVLLDLAPDVIVGFSIDNNNKAYSNLEQNGQKIIYNGDWTEQSPLGKAEWIKFFGVLYGLEAKANAQFETIVSDYNKAVALAKNTKTKPTAFSGGIYKDKWYLPGGNSWASLFIKDANASYLWGNTPETGSLSLSFETVLEKAENADFWIGPSHFTTLKQITDENPNYAFFKAYKTKNVYSFSSKKGKTGGVLYYELAPNRPDLVLKDLIKIMHPEVLPEHQLFFFEKLH